MKKIVFLEGLPGVGKTTIINRIREMNLNSIKLVDEILIDATEGDKQSVWINNDIKKITKYDDGIIIIDRGPISTLSYNETKDIISYNNELDEVYAFFNKYKYIYNDSITYYLKRKNENYYIPFNDFSNPYGSIENQKILEKVTLHNCKKMCNNLKIIDYDFDKIEEVINEIIN